MNQNDDEKCYTVALKACACLKETGLPLMGDTAGIVVGSFSSKISQQNIHFNMHTETSKRQQDCLCKQKFSQNDKF